MNAEQTSSDQSTIWILTDRRYLQQRMPSELVGELERIGINVRTVLVDTARVDIGSGAAESPLDSIRPGDVLVGRSRHPMALTLLAAAAELRCAIVNPWPAVDAVRDKARCIDRLKRADIPTPYTYLAHDLHALRDLPASVYPLVLKPYLGDNSEGIVVVTCSSELAELEWDDRMVLAQRWVETGGWDIKLYSCGADVWAVRRRSPLLDEDPDTTLVETLQVTPTLRAIAARCRDVFGLDLLGVDVLLSETGPVVVDVNEFPNYTGVEEATERIASLLVDRLGHVSAHVPSGVGAASQNHGGASCGS